MSLGQPDWGQRGHPATFRCLRSVAGFGHAHPLGKPNDGVEAREKLLSPLLVAGPKLRGQERVFLELMCAMADTAMHTVRQV
jgi:hypothetical protein